VSPLEGGEGKGEAGIWRGIWGSDNVLVILPKCWLYQHTHLWNAVTCENSSSFKLVIRPFCCMYVALQQSSLYKVKKQPQIRSLCLLPKSRLHGRSQAIPSKLKVERQKVRLLVLLQPHWGE
jgi:hypothetical protein